MSEFDDSFFFLLQLLNSTTEPDFKWDDNPYLEVNIYKFNSNSGKA